MTFRYDWPTVDAGFERTEIFDFVDDDDETPVQVDGVVTATLRTERRPRGEVVRDLAPEVDGNRVTVELSPADTAALAADGRNRYVWELTIEGVLVGEGFVAIRKGLTP